MRAVLPAIAASTVLLSASTTASAAATSRGLLKSSGDI